MPILWNLMTYLGIILLIVLALTGLVALVILAMPAPTRQRAIPRGTQPETKEAPAKKAQPLTLPGLDAAKRRTVADRVTQVQVNRAHAAAQEEDRDNRRQMAEGRA